MECSLSTQSVILGAVRNMDMPFNYGVDKLTVQKAMAMSRGQVKGDINASAEKVMACRKMVDQIVASERAVYGINTGFGPLCDVSISAEDTSLLQQNLILSHAVGVGDPIPQSLSRLMLICKLQALCQGYSGVRMELLTMVQKLLDKNLIPVVPEQGSVGASGDLAPLAHLFLPLLGEGHIWDDTKTRPTSEVYEQHGLQAISLSAKEGLALINGTQFILAFAIYGLDEMRYLLDLADLCGAMSLEGFQGSSSPFKEGLHALRPYAGTSTVAARMRALLSGSANLASHKNCDRVQDPYSIRCIPQVHGASRAAYNHLTELVDIEMNSVTDNPIILSEQESISGGNFHGQPLAMALDYATLAAAELGNISDRRCYLLLEGKYGLPRLLTANGGLDSGFMIPQYTTAALVTENKTLCYPASADSIPTSLGQEDHVSMGSISGRKFVQVLGNLQKILAIELMYAAQAMEFRRPLRSSDIIEEAHALIRSRIPKLEGDRLLHKDIDAMIDMVRDREFNVNADI